nr:ribulose bisphosphate carboxylase small chain, chloroplastic-like [Tanacetum cinerariifolium]
MASISSAVATKSNDFSSLPSNGGRVQCMKVWPPLGLKKFETLSYLPPLSEASLAKEVDYLLRNKWVPCLEFELEHGFVYREHGNTPGYYDGRYWTMWKLPMFGCTDSAQVFKELDECKKEYPEAFIRIIGFDNVRLILFSLSTLPFHVIMSGSKPSEMALERSRAVVMPKFHMHTYTSTLTSKELKEAITKYCIPMDLHPRLPPPELTMDKLPSQFIGIYIEQLEQGSLRIPFSAFFLALGHSIDRLFVLSVLQVVEGDLHGRLHANFGVGGTVVSKTKKLVPKDQRPQPHVTSPLAKGEPIPEKCPSQKAVEKPNSKIVVARVKKDKYNLAKAHINQETTYFGSDKTISVTPLHDVTPKPVEETVISVPKATFGTTARGSRTTHLEKEVVDLSENTRERVGLSDANSIHSIHHNQEGGSTAEHQFVPEWRLRDDLRISSFRAYKEMITHLATPTELEELNRLRNNLQRQMQTNDGLVKQLALLDSVHSSYEDKERELMDQLKEMERDMNDWRRTTLEQVEKIKTLKGELEPKSQRLVDVEEKVWLLEGENYMERQTSRALHQALPVYPERKVAESYHLLMDALLQFSPDLPFADTSTRPFAEVNIGDASTQVPPDVQTADATSNIPPQQAD